MLITLDFEPFYDTGYGLREMTLEEYIRDSRFEVIGFSIKVNDGPAQWFTADMLTLTAELHKYDWANAVMLGHNNRFDAAILNWKFGIRPKRYADTMSMARGLVGLSTSCSLDALGKFFGLSRFKGHEVVQAKGLRRADFSATQMAAYGSYCANDTEMCYDLFCRMAPLTLPDEMKLIDWTIRAYVEPKLVLDTAIIEQEIRNFDKRQADLLAACGITDISVLRSDDMMAGVLQQIGYEPPTKLSPKRKDADGNPLRVWAFSKQDIEFMEMLESDDEELVALVEARLGVKSSLLQSRLTRLHALSRRGPMPMPLVYAGATPTRRWSGDDNINVQNFPRNKVAKNPDGSTQVDANGDPVILYSPLRRAIKAPPGKKMVAADLSQIELRVNAWQSGQYDVLDILRNGGDVYSDQATALYGYTITKKTGKTTHQVERFVGKTTELQCAYQCGADKFLHSLKVAAKRDNMVLPDTSREFGVKIVEGYRQKRAKIRQFWYTAGNALTYLACGMQTSIGPYPVSDFKIHLPNGSFLYYPDLKQMEKEDPNEQGVEWSYARYQKGRMVRKKMYGGKLVENITQAVARLFVSDALLRLDAIRYPDGRRVFDVVFSVHDELVMLFDDGLDENWVRQTVEWAMTVPASWAPDLPLECEIGFGYDYATCK